MQEKNIKIGTEEVNYKYGTNKDNINNILILHGWGGSSDSWVEIGEMLYKSGYNVYIPDLPGFGKTKLNKVFNLNDYAKLVECFILKIGINNIILWGHSNGGAISIKLVNNFKIKINRLVLNNSAGIRNDTKRSLKRKFFNKIGNFIKKIKPKPKTCGKKCKVLKFFRTSFYKLIGSHDYLEAEKNPLLKKTYQNMINSDLLDEIKKIELDTLLIWGEKDTYTPLSDGKIMRTSIKNSKIVVIEDEKHGIHLKNPKKLFETFTQNI